MEQLLKKIEETYDIPLENQYDEKLELEFLQSFLKKFDIENDPLSVEKISNQELLLAYLCLADYRISFQELKQKISCFNSINYISAYESIKGILTLLFEFNDQNLVDHLAKIGFGTEGIDINNEDYKVIKDAGLISQLKKINSLLQYFII